MKIGIVANRAWNIVNYRLGLIVALKGAGHEVFVFAPSDASVDCLLKTGINFEHVPISQTGLNPLVDAWTTLKLRLALRRRNVDLVLSFTPKGNLQSLFANFGSRRCTVPTISGLGVVFTRAGLLPRIVQFLYRVALGFSSHVFFQNLEDMKEFQRSGLLRGLNHSRVPGSGVDLVKFCCDNRVELEADERSPVFLMLSRALWEKGLGVYVDAARQLRLVHPQARFLFAGQVIADRSGSVSYQQMAEWVRQGTIEYLGDLSDVRPALNVATCVVLPSWYREGVPRALLEAAAMRKPTITTRTPGCQDAVIDGSTGFLVEAGSVRSLVEAMQLIIDMTTEERSALGSRARQHVSENFDESLVLSEYLRVVKALPQAEHGRRFFFGRTKARLS